MNGNGGRGQQRLWNLSSPSTSIPANSRATVVVQTGFVPLVANRRLLLFNIGTTIVAATAADSLKIAGDAVLLFANLFDVNANFLSQMALGGQPWQQGALIPFDNSSVQSGASVALIGDPIFEIRGNLILLNPANPTIQVVQSVQFGADVQLRNTDGAAAHSAFVGLGVLHSEEPG